MSDGSGYGGDYGGKKPVKFIYLWEECCNCRTQAAMFIESTPSCPFCYHYRCSSCKVEKHRIPLISLSRRLSKESRRSPGVATSDSGTSLATPVAAGVAAKDLENANASDTYGAERFLMSLRPKRRLLGRGSKGFTRDEIVSALSKAVEGKQPLPLINALRQLAEATGASGSTHTAVKRSAGGAIPTLKDVGGRVKVANALAAIGNYLDTPSQDRFDDSDFKHTEARNWPEIPCEAQRGVHLMETKRQFNQYEELDPEFSSSYLGEKRGGGAYDPSDLEEDNKAVTHQQAAELVRTTAESDQEYEENFRGGPGNQLFPCKYCLTLQGEFGFWEFDHLKLHMKTKHNRELESESLISKRKISNNGRKYEKDDQQAGAADRAFDGPENEARMVPSEIDVEDQAAPFLGRQDQPTPPASHTPPPLQITESSSSQMKVITSSGGHHLGSSRTDPWSSSGFVEEEEDEGWDRDEDNCNGSIRGEDVQENIYSRFCS
jgi:hypothetical protein